MKKINIVKPSEYVNEKLLTEVAEEVFYFLGEDFEVNVKFACENCVRKLNKKYRGKDEPTNVLSFNIDKETKNGDILICESVVVKEATELRHAPQDLDLLYLVHGMLHLAGFDHTNNTERAKMEKAEETILNKVGVDIER